eukprot:gnl/Hemi2/11047_TR3794_c0_g1_i1.p1 gnl/Hemi2/11047_TR3794_c0_g1~~gnl/Hemi2/11047_TR3794_c0_g1_i1.p1  ORF type:complete len:546 (+),score=199.46 gnl/Hemi2/11047_TR3794_c0_g1_i1:123-1640(+)
MVLQRAPQAANIWGLADASAKLQVDFNGAKLDATADATGAWLVALPATNAGGPYTISVTNLGTQETASLSNVLFGDVWICSGQSNMQMCVAHAFNATEEIAAANNYPDIRVMTVGEQTTSSTPLPFLATVLQPWSVASNVSISNNGDGWSYFSATCWFFGRDLYDNIKVPIGFISSNWGGTYIQAWSSPEALSKCNQTGHEEPNLGVAPTSVARPDFKARPGHRLNRRPNGQPDPNTPSVLWNAMIVPFLNARISGVVWYQGEANVGHADYYACAFEAMIGDWQAKWLGWTDAAAPRPRAAGPQDIFTFLFVELAAYINDGTSALADLRQAQADALPLAKVGFATAVDLGDAASPDGNIHPRYKQEVGRRLSIAARAIQYNQSIAHQGPIYLNSSHARSGSQLNLTIHFYPDTVADGLTQSEGVPACPANTHCAGWELKLSDGNWYVPDATAVVGKADYTLVLNNATADLDLISVRFGYADWPICTLYNSAGFPVTPFVIWCTIC